MVRQVRDYECLTYPELKPGLKLSRPAGKAICPRWLSPAAKVFWKRHAPELRRQGLLDSMTRHSFAMLCCCWANLRQMEAAIADTPGAKGLQREYRQSLQVFWELARDFGLAPNTKA
jgi:phage terminase small subunit